MGFIISLSVRNSFGVSANNCPSSYIVSRRLITIQNTTFEKKCVIESSWGHIYSRIMFLRHGSLLWFIQKLVMKINTRNIVLMKPRFNALLHRNQKHGCAVFSCLLFLSRLWVDWRLKRDVVIVMVFYRMKTRVWVPIDAKNFLFITKSKSAREPLRHQSRSSLNIFSVENRVKPTPDYSPPSNTETCTCSLNICSMVLADGYLERTLSSEWRNLAVSDCRFDLFFIIWKQW
jgi:hypothetical protein